jgi:hypothetical protein
LRVLGTNVASRVEGEVMVGETTERKRGGGPRRPPSSVAGRWSTAVCGVALLLALAGLAALVASLI